MWKTLEINKKMCHVGRENGNKCSIIDSHWPSQVKELKSNLFYLLLGGCENEFALLERPMNNEDGIGFLTKAHATKAWCDRWCLVITGSWTNHVDSSGGPYVADRSHEGHT